MAPSAAPSLTDYYSQFWMIRGAATVVTALSVLLPKVSPGTSAEYLLAPLGNVDGIARLGVLTTSALATYVVFYVFRGQSSSARKKTFGWLLGASFVFLCTYLVLSMLFVRRIDIPTLQRAVYASVGYERSEFAKKNFGSLTDEEMLRERGITEEEVQRLWTPSSIIISRLGLFLAWCGIVLPIVGVLSLGALSQLDQAS